VSLLDWAVLLGSLGLIVGFGVWRNRHARDMNAYLLAGRSQSARAVAVSIMATQASAITFLSTPGQAYVDGMRFVQFYFGLPLAMIVLSVTAVPLFHRLQVFTAYELLEKRFDLKTRTLGTFLFLVPRALSTGVSIYATAIVLSVLLGWNITITNIVIGGLVILYTATGGSKAVAWTQGWQFAVAILGIVTAFVVIVLSLPDVSFGEATRVAGKLGKLRTIDLSFDPASRYNIWSGLIGGFFLQLAYFGTDQSQVGRYLGGASVGESRLGLLLNGLLKVPMQFFILFLGAMVFVFYQFVPPPLLFNPVETARIRASAAGPEFRALEARHVEAFTARRAAAEALVQAERSGDASRRAAAATSLQGAHGTLGAVRAEAVALVKAKGVKADTNDTNYIFLRFVLDHLPAGLVGLLLAVVFAASMSSNSAALNALASTTCVDVYGRLLRKGKADSHYVRVSKLATVFWGVFAIGCAMFSNRMGTLIEAVNILGSIFYGTMLGMFLIAFYLKRIGGTATFTGAIVGQLAVLACFAFTKLSYLWFNVVGCAVVIGVAIAVQSLSRAPAPVRQA